MLGNWLRKTAVVGLVNLTLLVLLTGVALAEEGAISSTAVFTGAVKLLSQGIDGELSNGGEVWIGGASSNLSCIIVNSKDNYLVAGDNNGKWDMFYSEGISGKWQILDSTTYDTYARSVSEDCNLIVFSRADKIGSGPILYLYNRSSEAVTLVSRAVDGSKVNATFTWIAPNSEYIFFSSPAFNIVEAPDANRGIDTLYRFEVSTGAITRVALNTEGQQANQAAARAVSVDGNLVYFGSSATNLPNDEGNG